MDGPVRVLGLEPRHRMGQYIIIAQLRCMVSAVVCQAMVRGFVAALYMLVRLDSTQHVMDHTF